MYYLDDFLELLEPFSVQFRDDLKRIGELDEEVKSLQAKLKEKSDEMFKECEKKQKMGMSKEQIHSQPTVIEHIKEIKKIHNKIKGKNLSYCFSGRSYIRIRLIHENLKSHELP